jgi:hypothetical protein
MRGNIWNADYHFFPNALPPDIVARERGPLVGGSGMNVARGLFRAWVVVSLLWIAGALALGVSDFRNSAANWKYHVVRNIRPDVRIRDADWTRPHYYYEWVRSWSKEGIEPEFAQVEDQFVENWNDEARLGRMQIHSFPDRSRMYLDAQLVEEDEAYLREHFWAQRWNRRARFAGERLMIALGPVAALFIAGYVPLWVARGFATKAPSR